MKPKTSHAQKIDRSRDNFAEAPMPAKSGQTAADKRAEADRRFRAARNRFLSEPANRELLIELAKR